MFVAVKQDSPSQKENARGERAFSVVDLGSWGLLHFTWRLWGAAKGPREFTKSLTDRRRVGTRDRHGLAGLDDARGLGVPAPRIAASRDAEARHRDTSHQRHDHNLEVGRAICAVDRMVHRSLL